MTIGGLQKISLIDYPGKISAVLFVSGCNFNCGFCYNPELVSSELIKKQPTIPLDSIYQFLKARKKLVDGVVFCGGEPTIFKDLPEIAKKIKKMGFFIKLDTNGSNPDILEEVLEKKIVDYVAMDIKTSREKYSLLVKNCDYLHKIEDSIDIIKKKSPDYEFRTTVVPGIVRDEDVLKIAKWIAPAKKYFLQQFKTIKNLDSAFQEIEPYSLEHLIEIQKTVAPHFETCQIRE